MADLQIVECPRDAMQGIQNFIPTDLKIKYLNLLLKLGFDTLDFGSFVSPKAVPQLADTAQVLEGLELNQVQTKLLAIVANMRGALDACQHPAIHYLGYPFSISETFQLRNTRKTIAQSQDLVKEMQDLCVKQGKELLIYISMGFGNPYGDAWSTDLVEEWVQFMADLEIETIALADTAGNASSSTIGKVFNQIIPQFPRQQISAHLHAMPTERIEKIRAAYNNGCRRFDTALMGFGGCPFAKDELVGNISTESLLSFCEEEGLDAGVLQEQLLPAASLAPQLFG